MAHSHTGNVCAGPGLARVSYAPRLDIGDSRMHVCRHSTTFVAGRSGNHSVGWKADGTSEVVSAVYFWNSQTLIGVGHLPHRVHPKWDGPRCYYRYASCSRHVTQGGNIRQHLRVRFIAVRGRDRDRGFSKLRSSKRRRSHAATV